MPSILEQLSVETLDKIANLNFQRFAKMSKLAGEGANGYRLDECEHYYFIWKEEVERLSTLGGRQSQMSDTVKLEYCDALSCGDYDSVLKTDELVAVERWREAP